MVPTPPQPSPADAASLAPYPLLSFVSYNHDLLKLRLSRLHVDFLYHYKLYTERTVDDNRRAEFTRGHSIHIAAFNTDTFPIRRLWARLFEEGQEAAGGLGKDEVKGEADEDDEVAEVERAKQHYATKVVGAQSAVRARSEPRLGLSHHLFRTEQERIEDERDEKEQTEQRLARKRARKEQWRIEIKTAVERALRKEEAEQQHDTSKEEAAEQMTDSERLSATSDTSIWHQSTQSKQQPPLTAKPEPAASTSPSPVTPARTSSPTATNRSPSPSTTPAAYASSPLSSAIPSLCEECGSRIDSMWSQCDFCGFDPLLSEGEEEEGTGRRKKKRGRAARIEKLMAQTALQEKKAKSQQEMNKLMETMSPWETT